MGSLDSRPRIPGTAPITFLPAGDFAVTPVPGTAEGRVVIEKMVWNGTEVTGLALTFERGRLTIGANPAVNLPLNTGKIVWIAPGAVTFGVGHNLWAGGSNGSGFAFVGQLGGATVKVDGKAVVESGALK